MALSGAHRRTRQHVQAIRIDAAYAETAAGATHQAIGRDLPAPARVLELPRLTPLDIEFERLRTSQNRA